MPTVPEPHNPQCNPAPVDTVNQRITRLIVVLEGGHDIHFLKHISRILHADNPECPDLQALEDSGTIVFIPIGGSNFHHWAHRLSGLGLPELHLLDREVSPLTEERLEAAEVVNRRPGCRAFLTRKRTMENYLAPECLREAREIDVTFDDEDDVPQLVASYQLERSGGPAWSELPARGRRRLRNQIKKWLNTEAVSRMTPGRLADRDPDGEVRSWLTAVAWLGGFRD